ncbi:hypothetical protein [Candidatus Nitrospira bockiana]
MVNSVDEEAFLAEVLGLFVLEAQEWINQCNTALLELEHHPTSDRKAKLYETIACGIANLGGSAATVELRDLETLSFALLPLLEVMRERVGTTPAEQLTVLRAALNSIIATVQGLTETKTGQVSGLDRLVRQVQTALRDGFAPATPESSQPTAPPEPTTAVMDKLQDFQRHHGPHGDPTRHMVDVVIRIAKKEYGEPGWRFISGSDVCQIVKDLDRVDEQFLSEVKKLLPGLIGLFSRAKSYQDGSFAQGVEELLHEVRALHDSARQAEAKALMLFFHGLQSFLTIVSQHAVEIPEDRFETIEHRLHGILPLAVQWADIGRAERAAIEQLVLQ